jgi:hypothetical protein
MYGLIQQLASIFLKHTSLLQQQFLKRLLASLNLAFLRKRKIDHLNMSQFGVFKNSILFVYIYPYRLTFCLDCYSFIVSLKIS